MQGYFFFNVMLIPVIRGTRHEKTALRGRDTRVSPVFNTACVFHESCIAGIGDAAAAYLLERDTSTCGTDVYFPSNITAALIRRAVLLTRSEFPPTRRGSLGQLVVCTGNAGGTVTAVRF